jgi:hypothetical protein
MMKCNCCGGFAKFDDGWCEWCHKTGKVNIFKWLYMFLYVDIWLELKRLIWHKFKPHPTRRTRQ